MATYELSICNNSQSELNDNSIVIFDISDNDSSESLMNNQDVIAMPDETYHSTEGFQIDTSHIIFEKNSDKNLDDLIEVEDFDSSYMHSSFEDDDTRNLINDKYLLNVKPLIKENSHKLDEIVKNSETSEAIITQLLIFFGLSVGELYSIIKDDVRYWVCPMNDCGKLHTRLMSLKTHILQHYCYKPFKCDFKDCTWSFYTSDKLKRHKESHSPNKKPFCCQTEGCSKRFSTIYNLRLHEKLHTRPKVYGCEVPGCEEVYPTKRALESHLKCHDPVYAPYKCPIETCGNSFFSYSALTSHSRSHQYKTDEVTCTWFNCGKVFDHPCRLKAHLRQHTGDRPYKCKVENCEASFITSSKLRRHERSHANDKRFTCSNGTCQKKFCRKDHLNEHIKKCTTKVTHICSKEGCGLSFESKLLLQKHVAERHSIIKKKINSRKSTKKKMGSKSAVDDSISEEPISNGNNINSQNINEFLQQNLQTDYPEIYKLCEGITYENGISIKIGDLSQNFENNEYILPDQIQENSFHFQIGDWQNIANLKNCVLSVDENGVLSVMPNNDVMDNPEFVEQIATINTATKEIVNNVEAINLNTQNCARLLTYEEISALKKMQTEENKLIQYEIISESPIDEVINNESTDGNDEVSSYDVINFDLNYQCMSLISQDILSAYKIQEVNNELNSNESPISNEPYLITSDKLCLMDENVIDNLNWKNDEYNRTNSLMQYELIESEFDPKNSENSLNTRMEDLLAMGDLNDNFYKTNENNFTAHDLKNDKNEKN